MPIQRMLAFIIESSPSMLPHSPTQLILQIPFCFKLAVNQEQLIHRLIQKAICEQAVLIKNTFVSFKTFLSWQQPLCGDQK